MPIQINGKKFIEYRYDPDYLQGGSAVCKRNSTGYPQNISTSNFPSFTVSALKTLRNVFPIFPNIAGGILALAPLGSE